VHFHKVLTKSYLILKIIYFW